MDNDKEKADKIMVVKKDVEKYLFFKRSKDLGITYTKRDLIFSEFLLFSLIKDEMND